MKINLLRLSFISWRSVVDCLLTFYLFFSSNESTNLLLYCYLNQFAAWEEQWDEFNETTIWINRKSNETRCTPPPQPLVPMMPASMINSTTGQPFNLAEIKQNEADTSISEEDSVDDVESRNSDEREKSNSIPPPPLGLHSEIELAEKRVKDMRMMRMGY